MTPTYQWLKDGSPLTGQTSATLSFSPLRQNMTLESTPVRPLHEIPLSVTSAGVSITVVGEFEWPCIIMEVTLTPTSYTVSTAPALSAVITASGMT